MQLTGLTAAMHLHPRTLLANQAVADAREL
jgi:hypothetical protein